MKKRICMMSLLAVLLLPSLLGCSAAGKQLNAAKAESRMDMAGNALQTAATPSNEGLLTKEQAQAIALEHAGFTADQVERLRTEYEIDDGIPRYEVRFRQGRWEYDYEINAETGAILSYDRDD